MLIEYSKKYQFLLKNGQDTKTAGVQRVKSENYMKCDKYVETGKQCGNCQRWFNFKCEGTTKKVYKST